MTKLILEGGTDVAEVALFPTDYIPDVDNENDLFQQMEEKNHLIRLPTGADGGYLLYIYIDEKIDKEIFEFCDKADVLEGELNLQNGNIAFGGVESIDINFKPNKYIRSDGKVDPGEYIYTAYRIEYPDEYVENKCIEVIGEKGLSYIDFPAWIIGLGVISAIIFFVLTINVSSSYLVPLLGMIIGTKVWFSMYTKSDKYKEIEKKKHAVEYQYPSIVVSLEEKHA